MRYDWNTELPLHAFKVTAGRMTLEGGGKGGTPDPPDYTGAAVAQGQSSREVTDVQNWANRPNQYTPWGSTTWETAQATDPATGKPITKWTQNQSLSPLSQEALNSQLALQNQRSGLAGGFMGRVAQDYQQPFDWNNLPKAAETPGAERTGTMGQITRGPGQTTQTTDEMGFSADRNRIEQGLFDRMRPEHAFQDEALRTRLANQGLTPGSTAYDRAMTLQANNQAGERFNAMNQAGQEQSRLQAGMLGQQGQAFGQGMQGAQFTNQALQNLQGQNMGANQQNFNQAMQGSNYQNQLRQQAIAEQAQRRGMSLNEMNAMLTGQQVQTPQMPTFSNASAAQPVNYLGAAQALGSYNTSNQQQGTDWGSLIGGLGGAAMKYGPALMV